jgi:putative intracellular protease/amidase
MKKSIVIPLPSIDFDPTEAAVPYVILKHFNVVFATPNGEIAKGDQRMLDGNGLGLMGPMLRAQDIAVKAYNEMISSYVFNHPISYKDINPKKFDAIIFPGGHAPGMKTYLESPVLHEMAQRMMKKDKIVAAICHGVLILSRADTLKERKVTALPRKSELLAWHITKKKLGNYYRTYSDTTVEDEVKASLSSPHDFLAGPPTLFRDNLKKIWPGFVVRDRNLVTARWPGDAHKFALEIKEMLKNRDQE